MAALRGLAAGRQTWACADLTCKGLLLLLGCCASTHTVPQLDPCSRLLIAAQNHFWVSHVPAADTRMLSSTNWLDKPTYGQRSAAAAIWICPETSCAHGGVPPPPCRGQRPTGCGCAADAASLSLLLVSSRCRLHKKNHGKVMLPC